MSTDQRAAAVLCGWEGNRRSGVVLTMSHRLFGISTYQLSGLRTGDDNTIYRRSMLDKTKLLQRDHEKIK